MHKFYLQRGDEPIVTARRSLVLSVLSGLMIGNLLGLILFL